MANLKKHLHGIIGSVGFLAFATLLLLLLGFTTPLPLPEEECVVLDFTEIGGGSSNTNIKQNATDSKSTKNPSEKILNDNTPKSPSIPGESITETYVNPNENRINHLFDNAFNSNYSENSTNTTNNNPGINGKNNSPNSGYGNLNRDRKFVKVDPIAKDNMFGVVILKITVNEKGKVTDVNLVSTTCDQCVKPAVEAVKKWQYEALLGSGYQIGIITLDFRQG